MFNPFKSIAHAIDDKIENKVSAAMGWLVIKLLRCAGRALLNMLCELDAVRADSEYKPALACIAHKPDDEQGG